jgi:hypothetical protein
LPPRSEPGPDVRGFSIVWLTEIRVPSDPRSPHPGAAEIGPPGGE